MNHLSGQTATLGATYGMHRNYSTHQQAKGFYLEGGFPQLALRGRHNRQKPLNP